MTEQQRRLYDAICGFWYQNGFAPSFEDLKRATGFRSKSSIHGLLQNLETDGWIAPRKHGRAGQIMPAEAAPKVRRAVDYGRKALREYSEGRRDVAGIVEAMHVMTGMLGNAHEL